jgi:hypothetical protein
LEVKFRDWVLNCDPDETRLAYNAMKEYTCGCASCKNFVVIRERAYPKDALALFDQLGIDHRKEAEVYSSHIKGTISYGGFFHFLGSILSGRDAYRQRAETAWTVELEPINENFSIGFTKQVALIPKPFEGKTVTQLDFWASNLPWVVSDPQPD